LFRAVADGEQSHAFGDLDFLFEIHDPVTGVTVGTSADNLRSAVEGEWHHHMNMYPGFARVAREEGFEEAAEWFEMLALAERNHARIFEQSLEDLSR
jgi:rubrerythrin